MNDKNDEFSPAFGMKTFRKTGLSFFTGLLIFGQSLLPQHADAKTHPPRARHPVKNKIENITSNFVETSGVTASSVIKTVTRQDLIKAAKIVDAKLEGSKVVYKIDPLTGKKIAVSRYGITLSSTHAHLDIEHLPLEKAAEEDVKEATLMLGKHMPESMIVVGVSNMMMSSKKEKMIYMSDHSANAMELWEKEKDYLLNRKNHANAAGWTKRLKDLLVIVKDMMKAEKKATDAAPVKNLFDTNSEGLTSAPKTMEQSIPVVTAAILK
jgi:hypothetical protein